jgi:hypothetical protein
MNSLCYLAENYLGRNPADGTVQELQIIANNRVREK